jgi:chromosome segregation ATPase
MTHRSLIVASLIALAALAFQPAVHAGQSTTAKKGSTTAPAKLYKWTDKDGVVHYGDQIPAEYADQHKQQINSQGQVTKEIEGAMTPEQRAEAEKRKAADAEAKARGENDKILLSTYGSVSDLERAREARLSSLQGQVTMASSTTSSIEKEIAKLEAQRGNAKDPKQVEKLDQQLAAQRRELTANQRHIVTRQEEMAQVRKQFDTDIKRFRELTAQPAPKATAPAATPATRKP